MPFEEFHSPAVEDVSVELYDTLIAGLGLVDIVDAVAVWRERVWHDEFTLTYRHRYRCQVVLGIFHSVAVGPCEPRDEVNPE